ncbi:Hypothetical protein GbCGDNIH3_7073 [Granulibacter bethesdensis]|uniref:Uncharacterized protein n=1 Tax=Granulibacter bethesdensis TaxID=364410 RepID=A0AAN0RE15_9PROT|nr:hypothetical protein [Granulibacter bethesdensis]AHJ63235.1 Hypothetical protein GbCGDNIH3_7073 [Granulibacter bethesdensis]
MTAFFAPATYTGVKAAFRRLIAALGGIEAAESYGFAARSLLSNYGNADSPRFPPAHIILDVEAAAGEVFVTEALARAQGYRLEKIETASTASVQPLPAAMRDWCLSQGKSLSAFLAAIADGSVDRAECDMIEASLLEHLRETVEAVRAVRHHREAPSS